MTIAPRCRHIKTNGLTCKSPALHGEARCFFHKRQMLRHSRFRAFADAPGLTRNGEHMPLIPIEDHDSIQLALSMVINGLAIGHLEPLRAKALLYGLQIASNNARNTRPEPSNRHDLALTTETDPVGDDLTQTGGMVDVTDPLVAFHQQEAERRMRAGSDDEDNDEEDDELGDEDDQDHEDDEQDDVDDIKVFNQVNNFMRHHS